MSTTTEAATWPRVEAMLNDDGTAEVSIGGTLHPIAAPSVEEARVQVVALLAHKATQLGRPLRAITRDPDGQWPLIIHGDGTVEEDTTTEPQTRSRTTRATQRTADVDVEPAPQPPTPRRTPRRPPTSLSPRRRLARRRGHGFAPPMTRPPPAPRRRPGVSVASRS